MRHDAIEKVTQRARELVSQIPFATDENIRVVTVIISDPIVTYETRDDGYYQIVDERGSRRESKVASDANEMINYFVHQAIDEFAHRYELAHRRKFESNLRQVHEVMERCYQYIDADKRFVKERYDDQVHIYLDLFNQYRQIAQDYKLKYPSKYERTKEDIDYIIDKKYADTPFGGMHNLHQSMSQVRVRVARIIQFDRLLKHEFDKFEMYYHALEKP